jgi:hypothetical protein
MQKYVKNLLMVLHNFQALQLSRFSVHYLPSAHNLHGVFGSDEHPVHLEQLQLSAPSKYHSDVIHRSINSKLQDIESDLLAQGLSQDREHHLLPTLSTSSPSTPVPVTTLNQSSVQTQTSLKSPRASAPLELTPTKEIRLTQFNLSTESVPVNRLPHQSTTASLLTSSKPTACKSSSPAVSLT